MENDSVVIEVDEESYEIKAIAAYIRGEMKAKDLQESLDVSRPVAYRMVKRYKEFGPAGLISKRIGMRNRAYPPKFRSHIMDIVRERYPDFGPTFAAEKLGEVHGIQIAAETLRIWMRDEGLWIDRKGRQPRVYSPRDPRQRRGELVQVDGSYHRWFEKRGPELCLIVFIDDATSELKILKLVEHETSYNYMACLKSYIEQFGFPLALFSDRHSIFRSTNPTATGERTPTQFSRACAKLKIQVICAKTPQAKGRVERANRTLQDRLVKELRLRNISTIDEANAYLAEYRAHHNRQFARLPVDPEDAHIAKPDLDLSSLLTYTVSRKVFKDLTMSFNKMRIILEDTELSRKAIGKRVILALSLEGELEVLFDETPLTYRVFDKIRRITDEPLVVDHKRLGAALAFSKAVCETEPHHFKRNAHILAGFRKHFQDPDDPTSRRLRDAPPEVRQKHNGRARGSLNRHPVVVMERRFEELRQQFEEDCLQTGIGLSQDDDLVLARGPDGAG